MDRRVPRGAVHVHDAGGTACTTLDGRVPWWAAFDGRAPDARPPCLVCVQAETMERGAHAMPTPDVKPPYWLQTSEAAQALAPTLLRATQRRFARSLLVCVR